MVDTTITHQLRTTLAKSVKDQNVNIEMLAVGNDTGKLKKHIAIFIERIAKGIALSSGSGQQDSTGWFVLPCLSAVNNGFTGRKTTGVSEAIAGIHTKYLFVRIFQLNRFMLTLPVL